MTPAKRSKTARKATADGLRANTRFYDGTPEQLADDNHPGRWIDVDDLVAVNDPIVEGREEYFDPA